MGRWRVYRVNEEKLDLGAAKDVRLRRMSAVVGLWEPFPRRAGAAAAPETMLASSFSSLNFRPRDRGRTVTLSKFRRQGSAPRLQRKRSRLPIQVCYARCATTR